MKKFKLNFIVLLFPLLIFSQTPKFNKFKADSSNWWKAEHFIDSLASISWNKGLAYLFQKNNRPKKQINIAVLDTDFDLNHKMLKNILWTNNNEIVGNFIDDDKNGYIDDYWGWNFLGIKNKDSSLAYVLVEESRILKRMDSVSFRSLRLKNKLPFGYEDVLSSYNSTVASLKDEIKPYKEIEANYTYIMDTLTKLFSDKVTLQNLSRYTTNNDTIMGYVNFAKYYYENDFPYDEFIRYLKLKELSLDICMNLNYNNRSLILDESEDFKDRYYGNHIFGKNISVLEHGTAVSGILASSVLDSMDMKNDKSVQNYPIKIMPITFTGIGDFTDKDFYVSFQYAIKNGANIINLSQGKTFSIEPKILKKALSLAERKNVLVVMSAGNQSRDLDQNWRFPQSVSRLFDKEFSNILIVGASSKKIGKNLLDENTNYGLHSVDIFAPGVDISTYLPFNEFTTKSGTSFAAPIVTNVAALIWSHYPELKASQVKNIILNSGVAYDGLVNIPYDEEKKLGSEKDIVQKPFQNLSKSGKIINAYNALILAESINSN
tara:strand:- start:2425 stop:4065 length:1641 start_codon:yes stop_codon:yes gene_type:complete